MYSIYKLNADELDARFLAAIKELFGDKKIEIVVTEAPDTQEDETAYLLRSPANRARLLKAIENVAHNENLVHVGLDELK